MAKKATSKNGLSSQQKDGLLKILKSRFEKNTARHKGIEWPKVLARLESKPDKLWVLNEMEESGGEVDVIGQDKKSGEYIFCDCSPESPKGRRSLCYDGEALASRKEHKPDGSAIEMAAEMGVEMLTEDEYRDLQKLGHFDAKTSSWLKTPDEVREMGGALFGDFRYGRVFVFHNGAESYYAARAFRANLRV